LWHFYAGRSLLTFQRFLLPPSSGHPDDGGSKHLLNVSKLLPDYTAQQPRRWPSSAFGKFAPLHTSGRSPST
jgi:hypothetical protein